MTHHECDFHEEIINLVSGVATANSGIENLGEKIDSLVKVIEKHEEDIASLKTFRSNSLAIFGVIGTLSGSLIGLLNGSFNWLIHK